MNTQISTPKSQTNFKAQSFKLLGNFNLGNLSLFGNWELEIGN